MAERRRKRQREEDVGEEQGSASINTCVINTPIVDIIDKPIASSNRVLKRQRITSYCEILKVGDVVFVWRSLGYKHYGLTFVEGVISEVGHNYVLVIHYWAHGSKFQACIRQDPLENFIGKEDGKLHVLDFSTRLVRLLYGAPLDPFQVLANAQRKLGKKGGKYNLIENNCEHFAIKCKTGKSKCWQSLKYKVAGGVLLLSSFMYPNFPTYTDN